MGGIERAGTGEQGGRAADVIIEQGEIAHGDRAIIVKVSEVKVLGGDARQRRQKSTQSRAGGMGQGIDAMR